jgi:23S rRNA pseudouridine955/2504/2580 synthase
VSTDVGKEAISSFKLKKILNSTSFIEIDIFTGRTHQIRVQSSHMGHPILNDAKYGDKNFNKAISPKKIKRMALHSSEIKFIDQEGIKIHAKSDIDEAFTILLDTLK